MKKKVGVGLLIAILLLACSAGWAGAEVGGSPGEGDMLAFGDHRYGQLGIGDPPQVPGT